MLVNGSGLPYVRVARRAYRLRLLNASCDRSLNLQLYFAASKPVTATGPGGRPELQAASGEVPMVPAVARTVGAAWPERWPTDGRAGGVPDPRAVGPSFIQFGNDGGLLPQAVVLPNTPMGYLRIAAGTSGDAGETGGSGVSRRRSASRRGRCTSRPASAPTSSSTSPGCPRPKLIPTTTRRRRHHRRLARRLLRRQPDLRAIGGAPAPWPAMHRTRAVMQFQMEGAAAKPFDLAACRPRCRPPTRRPGPRARPFKGLRLRLPPDCAARSPSETTGGLTFMPLGERYRLTLPVQGKSSPTCSNRPSAGERLRWGSRRRYPRAACVLACISAIDPATEWVPVAERASPPRLGDGTQLWRPRATGRWSTAFTS